jgi:hypothetical protein
MLLKSRNQIYVYGVGCFYLSTYSLLFEPGYLEPFDHSFSQHGVNVSGSGIITCY